MIVSLIRLHTRIETYVDKNVSFRIRLESLDATNWPVEAVLVPELFNQKRSHPVVMRTPLMGSDVLDGSQYLFDSEAEQGVPNSFQY